MKQALQTKPISELEAHGSEMVRDLVRQPGLLILTEEGEARAVLQDIKSFEETQETLALLKILVLGHRQIEAGEGIEAAEAFRHIRSRICKS